MVEIVEVKTKKQIKEFIEFPLKMYKGNPYFVPPLYVDEKGIFKDDYVYAKTCDAVYFLAYIDGDVVGRISGIIQKQSNEKTGEKRARFTRFDSVDDEEVAKALFKAVENWAKSKGMEIVCGPLGFSDLEREGLLIEGFDELSTFEEQYNYEYYGKLIENCGYEKEVDWVESKVYCPEKVDEKISRITQRTLAKYNLHAANCKNTAELIKKHAKGIFECLDICYRDLYGTVDFTEEMKNQMITQFKLIVNVKYVGVVLDEHDNVVAFGLCFPSIGKALQKSGGRLTLPTICKILKCVKKPEIIDLGLVAILPEYQRTGLSACIIEFLSKLMIDNKVKYCETNLNLEDNTSIQSLWKYFDHVNHKKRRSYIKNL